MSVVIEMYCWYRTTSNEQISSWEAVTASRLLWNPKVPYFAHISPLLVLILSQINPVRYIPVHFNGTLPFTPQSPACALSLRFLIGNLCVFLISVTRPAPPAHSPPPPLDVFTFKILSEYLVYKLWIISLCTFLHPRVKYFEVLLRGPSILLSTLFTIPQSVYQAGLRARVYTKAVCEPECIPRRFASQSVYQGGLRARVYTKAVCEPECIPSRFASLSVYQGVWRDRV
jgi:hypothetical protein